MLKTKKAFTLIELLIVIGVLGVLAAIILVAVDPAKRLRQARNARRSSEVNAILNAILNYSADAKGSLPAAIASATAVDQTLVIGTAGTSPSSTDCPNALTGAGTSTAYANLQGDTVLVDTYISEIPVDPRATNGTDTYDRSNTGYYVKRSANGRVEVGSCNPEDEGGVTPAIKIKR